MAEVTDYCLSVCMIGSIYCLEYIELVWLFYAQYMIVGYNCWSNQFYTIPLTIFVMSACYTSCDSSLWSMGSIGCIYCLCYYPTTRKFFFGPLYYE